jgi:hypothetical protein
MYLHGTFFGPLARPTCSRSPQLQLDLHEKARPMDIEKMEEITETMKSKDLE